MTCNKKQSVGVRINKMRLDQFVFSFMMAITFCGVGYAEHVETRQSDPSRYVSYLDNRRIHLEKANAFISHFDNGGYQVDILQPSGKMANMRLKRGERFKEGDVITLINGNSLPSPKLIENLVLLKKYHDPISISVARPFSATKESDERWGLRVKPDLEQDGAVIVAQVLPGSPMAEAGFKAGMRLVREDGKAFKSIQNFYRYLGRNKSVYIRVLMELETNH